MIIFTGKASRLFSLGRLLLLDLSPGSIFADFLILLGKTMKVEVFNKKNLPFDYHFYPFAIFFLENVIFFTRCKGSASSKTSGTDVSGLCVGLIKDKSKGLGGR